MEKQKATYSLFPSPPTSIPSRSRQSDERSRLSINQPPPFLPPQQALPPVPRSPSLAQHHQHTPTNALPRAPDSFTSLPEPSKRRSQNSFSQIQDLPPSRHSRHSRNKSDDLTPSLHSRHSSQTHPPQHEMHTSHLSTSSSPPTSTSTSSLSLSLSKPPPSLSPTQPPNHNPTPNSQHKTAYFHSGIGGRGNYRKVIRENDRAPLAHAVNAAQPRRKPSPTRFLSSLFGSKRRKDGGNGDGEGSGSEEEGGVSLGAAEVMRRKMLGIGGRGRL